MPTGLLCTMADTRRPRKRQRLAFTPCRIAGFFPTPSYCSWSRASVLPCCHPAGTLLDEPYYILFLHAMVQAQCLYSVCRRIKAYSSASGKLQTVRSVDDSVNKQAAFHIQTSRSRRLYSSPSSSPFAVHEQTNGRSGRGKPHPAHCAQRSSFSLAARLQISVC